MSNNTTPQTLINQVPSNRASRETLVKRHNAHLKSLEDEDNETRTVKQLVLEEGYQAATKPLKDLVVIPLSDLKVETHHRGQAIVVRSIVPPYRGAGTITIVEDGHGNADKLAIYSHGDNSILSNIPQGCFVAVKEPYYTDSGEKDYLICVDHPSDVSMLRFNDPIIPLSMRAETEQVMTKSFTEWREAADAAFIERDFPTAIFCYTEALKVTAELDGTKFLPGLYFKRAGTQLMLGRYDDAITDAMKACTGKLTDWRAYLTAAKAAYGLCDYPLSQSFFEAGLRECATAPGLRKEYERCLARIHEEEHGDYDFEAMFASLSPQNVHLDHANFTSNTYVASSPAHGNGLFAARRIRAGELVFVEKATLMPNQFEPLRASASLYAMMVRLMYENPSVGKDVLKLYGGDYARSGAEGDIVDGVPVVDVYLTESIRLKNCFSSPLSTVENTKPSMAASQDRMAKGLWRHASFLNHSCVPNTMRSFLGDIFISRAIRDIEVDEEICQQYVPVRANLETRQRQFREGWGFECGCGLCTAEAASPASMHEKRMAILEQVEKWARKRKPANHVPDAAIRHMERLTKQLEDLHEAEIYAKLPRLALVYPTMWLTQAHRGRKNHVKVVAAAAKLLRNFGFFLPIRVDGTVGDPMEMFTSWKPNDVALMTIHVVTVMKYTSEAYTALGEKDLAKQFENVAKFGFKIITGFENDLALLEET